MIPAQLHSAIGKVAHRIWNHRAWRYGTLFGLVLWGCCVQLDYRRPGVSAALLSWLGIGLSVLSFLFLVDYFYGRRTAGDPFHKTVRRVGRGATLILGIFVVYSAVLYVNGRFDQSPTIEQRAKILTITKTTLPGGLFGQVSVAMIRSSNSSNSSELSQAIILTGREPSVLWPGEPVLIHLRAGALSLPWVTRIEQDDEQYWRGVLVQLPEASEAWKQLVAFYFAHHRPKEAALAAEQYFQLRPDDGEYACDIAGTLAVHGLFVEARALLEPFVTRAPDYWTYGVMAAIFHRLGDDVRAEQLFLAAIALDPENAQAYFELGYVYKDMKRYEDAVAMFKKALQYRPLFPEMDEQIKLLSQHGHISDHPPPSARAASHQSWEK